jgi:hypothetical protein
MHRLLCDVTLDIGGLGDLMRSRSGTEMFDELASMEVCANLVVSAIFGVPERLERLVSQTHHNASLPHLSEVLSMFTGYLFNSVVIQEAGRESVPTTATSPSILALFTAQSVLVNAYLLIIAPPTSADAARHSSAVQHAVRYHVELELPTAFSKIALPCEFAGNDIKYCEFLSYQWAVHLRGLKAAIQSGKPFMTIPSTPPGSPI